MQGHCRWPCIGVALNGASWVPYGTVPELVAPERREHALGLFHTDTIGGGAIARAAGLGTASGAGAARHAGAPKVAWDCGHPRW